jgi:hypothetical protein
MQVPESAPGSGTAMAGTARDDVARMAGRREAAVRVAAPLVARTTRPSASPLVRAV